MTIKDEDEDRGLELVETEVPASDREVLLHQSLLNLSEIIHRTRADLAALRMGDISSLHVPIATDELDAVVTATEQATNTILDAAEALSEQADTMAGEQAGPMMDSVTRILEACSFQDITGQRIGKVIATLHQIEGSVGKMLKVFDASDIRDIAVERKPDASSGVIT